MSVELQSVLRYAIVTALPSGVLGDAVVLDVLGVGTLYVHNGTTWVAQGSPGAIATYGTTTIDFGASPGKAQASVDVTGLGGIGAGSVVSAWVVATATADHSADEHAVETLKIVAGNVVAGVGFTIYGQALVGRAHGTFTVAYSWS